MTEAYGARTVSLPIFATMTDAQQDAVVGAIGRRSPPARRYRRTRAPILNVRLVLPAVTTTAASGWRA